MLEKMISDFERRQTIEEEEKKVRCNLCKKLFRGIEFMKKHLSTKHEEEHQAVIRYRIEDITLEEYLKDPDKLTNTINYAGEGFRGVSGGDRRRAPIKKRPVSETPYEDLDDPQKLSNKPKRNVVDYSDL